MNKNTLYIYTHRSIFHNFIHRQFFTADCEKEQNRILSFTEFTTLNTWTWQFICINTQSLVELRTTHVISGYVCFFTPWNITGL